MVPQLGPECPEGAICSLGKIFIFDETDQQRKKWFQVILINYLMLMSVGICEHLFYTIHGGMCSVHITSFNPYDNPLN